MRFLLVIHMVLGLWAGLYAQEKFKMFASRYGDEMPEEYAKEVRVYEEVGPNKWYCKVYPYLAQVFTCVR